MVVGGVHMSIGRVDNLNVAGDGRSATGFWVELNAPRTLSRNVAASRCYLDVA